MSKKIHIVPHTHWDREWDFTLSRSKVYLMKDLEDVLNKLEEDNEFHHFVLDGQASLVEDYLRWRPEEKRRVENLVRSGKLIIGPWYTQTDQFIASGESIVRNLMYGINYCDSVGGSMKIGYVPDVFGQSGNMPQIYRSLGMDKVMLWRGLSDEEVYDSEFIWKGYDGTEIKAYQISCGYFLGALIDESKLDEFVSQDSIKEVINRSTTNQIYFPNGFDQAPIRKNLPEIVNKLNSIYEDYQFEISSIKKYTDAVDFENPVLSKHSGEFTTGKNMRVHKSIYSSRADLKSLNTKIQHLVVNILEPVVSLGSMLGITYPHGIIEEIWKLLFENSSHDSLGSCVNDVVNKEIYARYEKIKELIDNLLEVTLREVSERIEKTEKTELPVVIFNTLPKNRSGFFDFKLFVPLKEISLFDEELEVEIEVTECLDRTDYILSQIIKLNPGKEKFIPDHIYEIKGRAYVEDVPAFGYKKLSIKESTKHKTLENKTDNFIGNDFYEIYINETGSLDIFVKENKKWYRNQGVLEENGDDGDSFNYSPPRKDLIISSENQRREIQITQNKLSSTIRILYKFQVPLDLYNRQLKICDTEFPVTLAVTLNKSSDYIDFKLEIDNKKPLSHRLCVVFDSHFSNKVSLADTQFGTIKRPVYRNKEMDSWNRDSTKWNEKPISIETCQNFVSLTNHEETISIMPHGVREYEIIGDNYNKIRLTIFRTYGYMGKENLVYRPGRASGDKNIETPDAQLQKRLTFDFSFNIINQSFEHAEIAKLAKEINTPLYYYQTADYLNGRLRYCLPDFKKDLPSKFSVFESSGNLILSTIKKSENRIGYVIRLYNATEKNNLTEKLVFTQSIKKVELINLLEKKIEEKNIKNKTVTITNVKPAEFISIYVEFG